VAIPVRSFYGSFVYVRRSARVVLVDPDGAVLLVRSRFRRSIPGIEWAWFVPGGGVEAGETIHQAAVREVAEETGIDIRGRTLTHLAFAEGDGTVGESTGPMRDDVFTTVVAPTEVATGGMEPYELAALDRHRWWALADLRETSEPVFPKGLAATLDRFLSASAWPRPVRLPW
jgi:8-oxo-dGTP pyrophosphatase MutT (NUDIX family)